MIELEHVLSVGLLKYLTLGCLLPIVCIFVEEFLTLMLVFLLELELSVHENQLLPVWKYYTATSLLTDEHQQEFQYLILLVSSFSEFPVYFILSVQTIPSSASQKPQPCCCCWL
ncbi:hypothetical protein Hanom_Chr01g00033451 [Helianthus anomalus]